ncbi:MAG: lipid-binding SYLF domain-containing protein [Acidobacteria bacterium]|nr:lipid-binding SYLF domain-containing protein [Acidobacteriota bacterium]
MKIVKPFLGWTLIIVVALCALGTNATAQKKDAKNRAEAATTSGDATKALNELMRIPAKSIPQSLLKKAKAIAVFPGVIKAAFIIGGRGGKGLISRRVKGGWSAPAMFKIGGGSVGFQIGGSSTDVVMLFMTDDSLKNLLEDKFEIGGEAAAAAGLSDAQFGRQLTPSYRPRSFPTREARAYSPELRSRVRLSARTTIQISFCIHWRPRKC